MDDARDPSSSAPPYDRDYYVRVSRTEHVRRFGAHWWSNRYFARRVVTILRQIGGRRVLELGCAHGHVLRFLQDRAEAHGVDRSEHAIAVSRRVAPRAHTRVGDLLELDRLYARGQFDVVLAKSVLEHLADPGATLVAVRGLLRPRGVLLLSVPSTVNLLRPLKGARWIGTRDPSHLSLLAPAEWRALLGASGFAVLRSYSTGFWDVPYLPLVPSLIQLPLFAGPTVVALLTDGRFIPPALGENLIVEARALP